MSFVALFYSQVIPVGLWVAMLGMGLSLTPADIRNIFVMPKAVLIGTVGQHVLLPLLAFAIAALMAPTAAIAVGTVILAACPGGVTSNAYSFATRADVALSVSLTAVSSFLTLFTLPLLAWLALDYFLEAGAAPDLPILDTFYTLFALTVVPVAIGMYIRHRWSERSKRIIEAVRTATFIFLVLLIVVGTIVSSDVLRKHFVQAALVAVALNVLSMLMALGLGQLFRLSVPQRVTITFDVGVQNVSLASLVILSLLGKEEYFVVTLVYAVIMKVSALTFMIIARRWLSIDAKRVDWQRHDGQPVPATSDTRGFP